MNFLKTVNNWQSLGLQLGLLYPTLEKIETDNRGKVEQCKIAMIAAWLNQQDNVLQVGVPTWSVLQTALTKIGENVLSATISKKRGVLSVESSRAVWKSVRLASLKCPIILFVVLLLLIFLFYFI